MIRDARPSGCRCRMRTIAMPSAAALARIDATFSAFSSSNPASTSSASSTLGFVSSVRARLTLAAWPPDRSCGGRSRSTSPHPMSSSVFRILESGRTSLEDVLRGPDFDGCRTASVNGSRIACATVSPSSTGFCGRYATCVRHCCGVKSSTERPERRYSPSARGLSRAKAVSNELFPTPDGPTRSTISPASMSNDSPEKIVRRSPSTMIEQRTFEASNKCVMVKTIR